MKFIIAFLILPAQLFALTIALNSGEEKKNHYAILHVIDTEPLMCEEIKNALEEKQYRCSSKKPLNRPIETKKTQYATLEFYEKKGLFYLDITPLMASRLIPVEEPLYATKEVLVQAPQKSYRHWMIVFEEEPLYVTTKAHQGLDFPIPFERYQHPFVDALDLNGAPISYAQTKDIELYLEIKRLYEKEDYTKVIKEAKKGLTSFPNSIFRSDMELFAIRSMDKVLENKEENRQSSLSEEALLELSKQWIKSFPSDENLPEVLMIMLKSYLTLGSKADVGYIMDTLMVEHPESLFTKRAMLIFADTLFAQREKEKAVKLYKEVLYSTKDVDLASQAAMRLAEHQIDVGNRQEATEYLQKILNANQEYLRKNKKASLKLANRLAEHQLYDLSGQIYATLLSAAAHVGDNQEILLKESGNIYAKAGMIDKAYEQYERYLREYPQGEYANDVQMSLDELFFQKTKTSETLGYYDSLIKQYANSAIGQKALEQKAIFLFEQKRYKEVLEHEDALLLLPSIDNALPQSFLYETANHFMVQELQNNACQEVVQLIETYKLQIIPPIDEEKLLTCFITTSRYERAQEIAKVHLQDTNLSQRFFWMQSYAIATLKLKTYATLDMTLSQDILSLSKQLQIPVKLELLEALFTQAIYTKNLQKGLEYLALVEKDYPNAAHILDLYAAMIGLANDQKEDLILTTYAPKMMAWQKKLHTTLYSPFVEFNYIAALKRLGKNQEAYAVVVELVKNPSLKPDELVRVLYHGGEISLKLNDKAKAKEYFFKCTQMKEKSPWVNICEENLKLL